MTTTTMLTSLDLVTPLPPPGRQLERRIGIGGGGATFVHTDGEPDETFSTVVLSDGLVTQSAPNTPIQHRENANAEFNPSGANQMMAAVNVQKPNNDFYRAGIGSLRDGFFACFRPVWGYFGKPPSEIQKSEEDGWEIPFDAISELEWLGSGSQGAVFRGQLNYKTVAVKKVNRLKDTEIKHLRKLSHKNIIDFYGICSKSPCFCIVMEYCSKGQLCHVLKSQEIMDREVWSKWVREIADGMHYLHTNKVIHRDLKSPNILINHDDSIKICDFGTSHLQEKNNSTMMSFCGTVSWMAPEMIKKEPCNEKVDVYSFGVVLWEMLTREQPFANIDQMAVIFGVGTNILTLPIPETAPRGLVLLIKQCMSTKGRNRPSFSHIKQHFEIFKPELDEMTEEEWARNCVEWNQFAKGIEYPSTVTKKNVNRNEEQIHKKRAEQLNHIKDIRYMYEQKLKRANKMYDKLQGCFNELKLKENELQEWEKQLEERESANITSPKSFYVRTGPNHSRYYDQCVSGIYPNEMCEGLSSDEETGREYLRGSPYRCSQASSSSGVPSSSQSTPFSRQSSSRSSSGLTRRSEGLPVQPSKILRNDNMRHSASYWETVRGSPARGSGVSQDSGVWSAAASCNVLNSGGQQVCISQTLYRNGDGRWSDGKIASRRRPSASAKRSSTYFQRDSPSRVPHGSLFSTPRSSGKLNRASYPSRNAPPLEDFCGCQCQHSIQCCNRNARAKSIAVPNRARSPTPYDNPTELDVSSLPESSSYSEALKSAAEPVVHDEMERPPEVCAVHIKEASPVRFVGFTNPIYNSPVTTYKNPMSRDEENANDVDLTSSMDSRVSRRSRADDADVSAESSTDDDKETNGNILNASIDSRSSKGSGDEIVTRRQYNIMDTSQSTMMSSLERSLEIGAARSDGLSDNEARVQAVKNSIKGHRRTHSNPQAIIHQIIDESFSSSAADDSDDAAVEI